MTMSPIAMAERDNALSLALLLLVGWEADVPLTYGNAIELDRVERRLHPRYELANEHANDHRHEDERRQQSVKDTQPLE